MRNIFSFIFIIFSAVTYSQTMDFRFTNGNSASFDTANVRKITHNGSELNLFLRNESPITYNMEDIVYSNFDAAPVLLTSTPVLQEYDSLCVGSASSPFSYTLTGYDLTGNVQIQAPDNFEISIDSISGYTSNLDLTPTSGNLNATIFVRFLPSDSSVNNEPVTSSVNYNKLLTGLIAHQSTDATTRNLGVLGTGMRTGKWIGPSRGDWVNAANWCGGIPDSTVDVIIPPGDTVDVNATANCKSLFLHNISSPQSALYGGSSMLNIYGDFIPEGNFIPQTGTVIYRGNFPEQEIGSLENTYYNLTINKSSGRAQSYILTVQNNFSLESDSLVITPNGQLHLQGNANFNNKTVILQSDATGTASIPALPNNGSDLLGATKVTIERYIPAGLKWRGLSAPLSSATAGNSIFNSWQNNGSVINGQGVLLWSPTAQTGFSLNTNTGASQNIRKYIGGSGFSLLSNTNEPLFSSGKPVPYLVFVTDHYKTGTNVGNMGNTASATTLRATGTLYKGDYLSGNLVTGFHMIPNPYPAAINFNNASINGDLVNQFWIWDPQLDGFRGFGGYQTFSGGVLAPDGGSYAGSTEESIIPSGAAFWVYSDGNGAINMSESTKKNGASTLSVFRQHSSSQNKVLRVNLMDGTKLLDGVAAAFNANSSLGIDKLDARKFGLGAENIFLRRNQMNLAIEFHPAVQANDTIYVGLNQLSQKPYSLQISGNNFETNTNTSAVLEDLYLNKETMIDLQGTTKVDFAVNDQSASSGNRFRIVFRSNAITPVSMLDAEKGMSIYPNPVQKGGLVQMQLNNQSAGEYRLVLIDISGVQVMNKVFQHSGGTAVQSVWISDKLAAGNYVAELTDMKGKSQQLKITVQ